MTTQQHLPIKDIQENIVILKDGTMSMVIQTTAVNFDLLSENEQLSIIESFAQFLNSLSFVIQIVIRSKRLDISNYLSLLSQAQQQQTNPLLKQIMQRYQTFVTTTIKENEVLDKQFYIVIPISFYEVGLTNNTTANFDKAKTMLSPRRDLVLKQLTRLGLKGTVLDNEKLIRLFYDIYNESATAETVPQPKVQPAKIQATTPAAATYVPTVTGQPATPAPPAPAQPIAPQSQPQTAPPARPQPNVVSRLNSNTPFVVEELGDEYGYV